MSTYPLRGKGLDLVVCVSALVWFFVAVTVIGVIYVLLFGLFSFATQLAFIAHIRGSGVRLGFDQFPKLHERVMGLSRAMGMEAPETYVMQFGGDLNAFASHGSNERTHRLRRQRRNDRPSHPCHHEPEALSDPRLARRPCLPLGRLRPALPRERSHALTSSSLVDRGRALHRDPGAEPLSRPTVDTFHLSVSGGTFKHVPRRLPRLEHP